MLVCIKYLISMQYQQQVCSSWPHEPHIMRATALVVTTHIFHVTGRQKHTPHYWRSSCAVVIVNDNAITHMLQDCVCLYLAVQSAILSQPRLRDHSRSLWKQGTSGEYHVHVKWKRKPACWREWGGTCRDPVSCVRLRACNHRVCSRLACGHTQSKVCNLRYNCLFVRLKTTFLVLCIVPGWL